MKTPRRRQTRSDSGARFYRWIWLLAIFLVGCVAVQPVPSVPGGDVGENGASAASAAGEAIPASSVAILVVDFFNPAPQLPEKLDSNDNVIANCLAGPNGFGHASEGAGGSSGSTGVTEDIAATTTFPHGDLVYYHLLQLFEPISSEVGNENPGTISALLQLDHRQIGSQDIYLAKIDVGGNYTDDILNVIDAVRIELRNLGVEYFIVNLSLVVKPCTSFFQIDDGNIENFEWYLQFVQCIGTLDRQREIWIGDSANQEFIPEIDLPLAQWANLIAAYDVDPRAEEISSPEALIDCTAPNGETRSPELMESLLAYSNTFYENTVNDPLSLISQNPENRLLDENTFMIAAAGNDGLPYPYAPAIFRHIVSVGADVPSGEDHGYSPNAAEWILDDRFGWEVEGVEGVDMVVLKHKQPNSPGADEIVNPGQFVTLTGTSFATPKLSYLTAMSLLADVATVDCYDAMVYAAPFVPDQIDQLDSLPLPADQIWQDKPIYWLPGDCATFSMAPLP